jgi:uridine kinase
MKTYLIGIAGPSCSGKTELAKAIRPLLPGDVGVVSLDSYYHPLEGLSLEERSARNFDHPDALDWEMIVRDIRRLSEGEGIEEPVYLFERHTRADYSRRVGPAPFVIVEGLFALYDVRVRQLLSARFFVAAPDGACFERRKRRDMLERGRTLESVCRQYAQTVRPMAEQFVIPTQRHADLVVRGDQPLEDSVAAILEYLEKGRPAHSRLATAGH